MGDGRELWRGGVITAADRAAAEGLVFVPLVSDFGGVSKGLLRLRSWFSSSPSLGRRDSVEPLFLSDRVGGRSFSVNRASSIWRSAIWLLSSSSLLFQSGTEVVMVFKASKVEKAEKAAIASLPV